MGLLCDLRLLINIMCAETIESLLKTNKYALHATFSTQQTIADLPPYR
jgi:hypothetical protein